MKNRRRQTDKLEDRMQAVELSCDTMKGCIDENGKILAEQGKIQFDILSKLDTLNEQTSGVVQAYSDARTWIRVTKWGSGVFALFAGAVYGFLKIKGGP